MTDLRLPPEALARIADLNIDGPPDPRYERVVDALAREQICSGRSTEGTIAKAVRLSLWALVHYPGQYIPRHWFLRWATGEHVHHLSPRVRELRVDKVRDAIQELGIPCVGLITQRWTTDPSTVDGFRLTTSGDDYVRHVVLPSGRRTRSAVARYLDGLGHGR